MFVVQGTNLPNWEDDVCVSNYGSGARIRSCHERLRFFLFPGNAAQLQGSPGSTFAPHSACGPASSSRTPVMAASTWRTSIDIMCNIQQTVTHVLYVLRQRMACARHDWHVACDLISVKQTLASLLLAPIRARACSAAPETWLRPDVHSAAASVRGIATALQFHFPL